MKKQRIHALQAFSIRLGILLFALWLLCMGIVTYGTAQYFFNELYLQGTQLAATIGHEKKLRYLYQHEIRSSEAENLPAAVEYSMLDLINDAEYYPSLPKVYDETGLSNLFHSSNADGRTAAMFLDANGNVLHQSDEFFYFSYRTKTSQYDDYGWMDLSNKADERYDVLRNEDLDMHDIHAMRLTGRFEDTHFIPYSIAILDHDTYYFTVAPHISDMSSDTRTSDKDPEFNVSEDEATAQSIESAVSILEEDTLPKYSLEELDDMGLIEWTIKYEDSDLLNSDPEAITIYTTDMRINLYQDEQRVKYEKKTYQNLLTLLDHMDFHDEQGTFSIDKEASEYSLSNMIMFSTQPYIDTAYDEEASRIPNATFVVVMQASPLHIAMSVLRNIYILTGFAAFLGYVLLRRSVKKHLIQPLSEVNQCTASGWTLLPSWPDHPPQWKEPYEISSFYMQAQDKLFHDKNEITRLSTALRYTETAEQNRRQMTSNIAHELKTPLAIIHSYAEGLKEHIAEGKRDKYVDVILSESEHMDQMVLEMLDLSRLEAGRVQLSRNDFSLVALTKSIFAKLAMTIQKNDLRIKFSFPEDSIITADEKRIAQVIENFVTNAMKYTPKGGQIHVSIRNEQHEVTFMLENESEPLTKEALQKVWDTFYRSEKARSERGTGLGLAIAKSIIELHRGDCFVHNTETGVIFGFTLNYDPS